MVSSERSPLAHSKSAPLPRPTYTPVRMSRRLRGASVLESALIGLGRADLEVQSSRKPRLPRSPEPALELENNEDDDLCVRLQLRKTKRSRHAVVTPKEQRETGGGGTEFVSPPVTRSVTKHRRSVSKQRRSVSKKYDLSAETGTYPLRRTPARMKKWELSSSSLEVIETAEEDDSSDDGTMDFSFQQDEDEVQIQKKLFATPEKKPRKSKKNEKKRKLAEGGDEDEGSDSDAVQKKKGRRKANHLPREPLREVEVTRSNRRAVPLCDWRVEWPPTLVDDGNANDYESESEPQLRLVVTGKVLGKSAHFVVEKREGATRFTSAEGDLVALSGCLDRDAARSGGMPRAAMKLLREGVPSYWRKCLLPFAERPKQRAKRSKAGPKKTIKGVSKGTKRAITEPDAEAEPTKAKRARGSAPQKTTKPTKRTKKQQPKAEVEVEDWTEEQKQALADAKMRVPTTASNFWAEVATFVPGKSAKECQAKTFERFKSPPRAVSNKRVNRSAAKESVAAIPTKIARAGSNKFKKQVREFVQEYEKKHEDDIFEETTPSKNGLPALPDFEALKSPGADVSTPSRNSVDDSFDNDDDTPGLLTKLSARRRDDVDSYVLGINRQHVAGGGIMAGGKARRSTATAVALQTPKDKKKTSKKKAVQLMEECGSHVLKGVVSPGGTTHVQVEKDGSSSEEEDYYRSSGDETGSDYD